MSFLRGILLAGVLPMLAVAWLLRPGLVPDNGEITADDVREAIEYGIAYLKKQQKADGSWPERKGYGGGLTPLCTLALLHAGCKVDDDAVKRALAFLRTFEPKATYAASLQTMALCAGDPARDRALITRNVRWIESRQVKDGGSMGMWAQPAAGSPDHIDNSMTHMAMLALYEAERVGISVNAKTWRLAADYWKKSQNSDGSWGWGPGYPGSGSMTTAGIAVTIIASGQLNPPDATVSGDTVDCCGEQRTLSQVDRALSWLERNFSVTRNPGTDFWHSYYLYSLERAGRMTAQRFIGSHDWYREGARVLVKQQRVTGEWPPDMDDEHVGDAHVATSFSLMFLAKARRPVILAQVKHEPGDDWNRHRSALFNMVGYVERAWRRDLTYQVIDVTNSTVEDLLETPVLYLSGRDAPQFTAEDKEKLRMYVDRGGFIFAVQSCSGGDFDQGFRKLMREVFPEPAAELRLLPPSHPVWYGEEPVEPSQTRELWGIDLGCRTSVVYCPADLACYWELARIGREAPYSEAVQKQIEAARSIGINVLAYATNRELKYKDPAEHAPASKPTEAARGALSVANVVHAGGCDTAPLALKTLLRLAANQLKLPDQGDPGEVRLSDPALYQYSLIALHGRADFRLTPEERKQLRTYLERGGVLFADALCSSRAFVEAFRRELAAVFPNQKLERIALTHPLFTSEFGGHELSSVSRRELEKSPDRPGLRSVVRPGEPVLEGLTIGGRLAVIFSPYDVSCALSSHDTLECEGYAREDAARIAINVLLYSLHE